MIGYYIAGILLILAAGLLLRSQYERKTLLVSSYTLSSPVLPDAFQGYRIVFLSDLHGASFGEKNEDLAQKVLSLKPDVILIGGDMITAGKDSYRGLSELDGLLSHFHGIPVYYGYGNHETRLLSFPDGGKAYDDLQRHLASYNVTVLCNSRAYISRGSEKIAVAGILFTEDQYRKGRKRPLPAGFFDEAGAHEPGVFEILLAHSPMYLQEAASYGADLTLSGHFHGGTIRLPKLGGVMTPQFQFFYPYCKGMFLFGEKAGIVSAGLGTHTVNIRLNDPPDIVLVTLLSNDAS